MRFNHFLPAMADPENITLKSLRKLGAERNNHRKLTKKSHKMNIKYSLVQSLIIYPKYKRDLFGFSDEEDPVQFVLVALHSQQTLQQFPGQSRAGCGMCSCKLCCLQGPCPASQGCSLRSPPGTAPCSAGSPQRHGELITTKLGV